MSAELEAAPLEEAVSILVVRVDRSRDGASTDKVTLHPSLAKEGAQMHE